MANLIIQENGVARTTPAVHGEEITIQAPCDCSAVTGVQIAGVAYPFYDAAGNVLVSGSGLFSKGSLIRVLIDTANVRSTIINHAVPIPDVSGQISTHNTDATAHQGVLAPMYTFGTTDLTAGSSALPSGQLHFVYE